MFSEHLNMSTFVVCLQYINFKPVIVTVQYHSRAGISNVKKSHTSLYILVGVAGEARKWKINAKSFEFLILKEIYSSEI